MRAARVDRRGNLRFADWQQCDNLEFLYDGFFERDGRLQWIAQFWDHQPYLPESDRSLYLMVDCAGATADDHCAEVFARLYGTPAADLYQDAIGEVDDRPVDFNVFDGHRKTVVYIRRRIAARGLTHEDFLLPALARDRGPSALD